MSYFLHPWLFSLLPLGSLQFAQIPLEELSTELQFFCLAIAQQSTKITSCALQAKLLFIHRSTAFASFSTTHNHVQLVILFYPPLNPLLQNCDLVDLSLHCISVVHYSCQGTIVCSCPYWITFHFFRVYLQFAKIIMNSNLVLQQIHSCRPPAWCHL